MNQGKIHAATNPDVVVSQLWVRLFPLVLITEIISI